jgi:hypothetical protein
LASLALPAFAQERVTVAQLDQIVTTLQGTHDGQAAQRLSELELTERLSEPHLVRLRADLPGQATQKRLALLADVSAFLDLPASELPSTPMPDRATQTHLFSLAHDYVVSTLLKLPNLFATRHTTSFESTPADTRVASMNTLLFEPYEEFHHFDVTVLYRDGRELIAEGRKLAGSAKELRTVGEFGPILVTVLNDCGKGGTVVWSHWEQGSTGPQAVFRYVIPQRASHYMVTFHGLTSKLEHYPGYHGEIALNPADGSILRLTIVTELNPNDAATRAELMVHYEPTEIGGMQYICPVKSVALATARMVVEGNNLAGRPNDYLNEVRFTDYHIFRSELRILAGDSNPDATPPTPVP